MNGVAEIYLLVSRVTYVSKNNDQTIGWYIALFQPQCLVCYQV